MGNTRSKPKESAQESSVLIHKCCVDVQAEIFGFLEANDQAKLRRTSKHFCTVFNHAFQRGYVAAAIHEGYVDKLDAMHEDGDDGHPLLHVAPVLPYYLFFDPESLWDQKQPMERSESDKDATLFVNVRLVLAWWVWSCDEFKLQDYFLSDVVFKAIHFFGTETVEEIRGEFLCGAKVQTFTMTTPCPKLTKIGNKWLDDCRNLTHFDISGCCALERVGDNWLDNCSALESASFEGCHKLEAVGWNWMRQCSSLASVDFSPCRALRSVEAGWLWGCSALRMIDLHGCGALRCVGGDFLVGGSFVRYDLPPIECILVPEDHTLPASITKGFEKCCVVREGK